jgi:hypothetical protein
MSTSRIHYLVADYDQPSWGTALLSEHVAILRELGFDARIIHHRSPFRLTWVDREVPIVHLDSLDEVPGEDDLLVVPETLAAEAAGLDWPCRRWVYVQGSFLILPGLGGALRYPELGYEHALAVLPHVARIVERHFGLVPEVVPPFVAPYFFTPDDAAEVRSRTILLAVKPDYRSVGFPDYRIFTGLVGRRLEEAAAGSGWRLEELAGLRHTEIAERMADASFLVNLNSHEAFNSTVPEAMAAGCVPVCYDAFGGLDFLADGENAFVFPNHHIYPLVETLFELMTPSPEREGELRRMRRAARATARRFTREATRAALERVFTRFTEGRLTSRRRA